MNMNLQSLLKNKKISTAVFIIGIAGILLIYLSGLFGSSSKPVTQSNNVLSEDDYCKRIEDSINKLTVSITGSENVQVIVTLNSSYEYIYLNEKDLSNDYTNDGDVTTKKKDDSSEKYIIVEDSAGNEQGLVVTTLMPTVRGVVIIYGGQEKEAVTQRIQSAVMAALGISKSKIYVSGTI